MYFSNGYTTYSLTSTLIIFNIGINLYDFWLLFLKVGSIIILDATNIKLALIFNLKNKIIFNLKRGRNQFKYLHSSLSLESNHTNSCHKLPSIEDTWGKDNWAPSMFVFMLATSEVDSCFVVQHFL